MEAFVAALDETNKESRAISISEYISHMATYHDTYPLYLVNFDCTGEASNVVSSQAIVASEITVEGSAIFVAADHQFWDIGVSCENDEFVNYGISGKLEKLFSEDRLTGTAKFSGTVYYGKKNHDCSFDFSLVFDLETGKGLSAEGTLCDENADTHASRITVPGFSDEQKLASD